MKISIELSKGRSSQHLHGVFVIQLKCNRFIVICPLYSRHWYWLWYTPLASLSFQFNHIILLNEFTKLPVMCSTKWKALRKAQVLLTSVKEVSPHIESFTFSQFFFLLDMKEQIQKKHFNFTHFTNIRIFRRSGKQYRLHECCHKVIYSDWPMVEILVARIDEDGVSPSYRLNSCI